MRKTPEEEVDELLAEIAPVARRNAVADNPPLAAAIQRFLELKAAGDPRAHVSLNWFYREKLRERFGGPNITTVCTYVREFLRLDRNGQPLGQET